MSATPATQTTDTRALVFPPDFAWGVATAAHQYEGGNTNNQWHEWEQTGHIVPGGGMSGLACDWWAHAEADFDRAQALHLKALRFSVEWSRIEPAEGQWNDAALERYRQMLIGLHARGITPTVCLHHFTDPLWLTRRGGFLAVDVERLFERYATHVVAALKDLCTNWITINEPNVYAARGYTLGDFPPGHQYDAVNTLKVMATMARCHAAAYHAIHRQQPAAMVGWAHHYYAFDPANPQSRLDRWAAHNQDEGFNQFFLHAIEDGAVTGIYKGPAGDLSAAKGTCDMVGFNVYARNLVAFDPRRPRARFARPFVAPGALRGDGGDETAYGESYPQGIARLAHRIAHWHKPIVITENGIPDATDRIRPWLIANALRIVHDLIGEGIDIRGYHHWSLIDNYEWDQGWRLRFGLFALDQATQARQMRPSAAFYAAIAEANALTEAQVAHYAPSALATVFPHTN